MKTVLISLLTALGAAVLFKADAFTFLDLTSDEFDITWEDITEDLWP